MVSDFSLKYVIKHWDTNLLGKNPFETVTEYGGNVTLGWNKDELLECVSTQLEKLAQLSSETTSIVNA